MERLFYQEQFFFSKLNNSASTRFHSRFNLVQSILQKVIEALMNLFTIFPRLKGTSTTVNRFSFGRLRQLLPGPKLRCSFCIRAVSIYTGHPNNVQWLSATFSNFLPVDCIRCDV